MDKTTNSAINEYTKLVQEHYKNLAAAYVFGSYAKNTAHQDSDIDLALIFEHLEQVERFDLQVKMM